MGLREFIKLGTKERAELVISKGVLIDGFVDGGESTQVYFYNDFFVELSISVKDDKVEALPFISGYRKENYSLLKNNN